MSPAELACSSCVSLSVAYLLSVVSSCCRACASVLGNSGGGEVSSPLRRPPGRPSLGPPPLWVVSDSSLLRWVILRRGFPPRFVALSYSSRLFPPRERVIPLGHPLGKPQEIFTKRALSPCRVYIYPFIPLEPNPEIIEPQYKSDYPFCLTSLASFLIPKLIS